MSRAPSDLLFGTLDVLILKTLTWGEQHGYAIAKGIEERSRGVFEVEDGALYKALRRLEESGAVVAEWGVSESNRRARFYRLTTAGRRQLRSESATWREYAAAVVRVLDGVPEGAA